MPSTVCLLQTILPLDMLVVVFETKERAALSAVADNDLSMGGEGASNLTNFSNCHNAPASASTTSDITSVAPWTVSPVNEMMALFGEPSTHQTKRRGRKRLSDDKKIDLALTAL